MKEWVPVNFAKVAKKAIDNKYQVAKILNENKDIPKLSDAESELLIFGGLPLLRYLDKHDLSISDIKKDNIARNLLKD